MRFISLTAFLCFNLSLVAQSVTTVTFTSLEDASTTSGSLFSGTNYGTNQTISVSVSTFLSNTIYSRSFVRFNLASIPSNAVITSAKLKLIPSGTENVGATNSTELAAELCNSTWTEGTITHNSGIDYNTLFTSVQLSSLVSGKREFIVTPHVQAIVEQRVPNYGWRIKRTNETTVVATQYYSKESTTDNPPLLEVSYYTPVSITSATIVHESQSGASDGSITPVLSGGSSSTKTYQWYNSAGVAISGATNLALTGKPYGWYGLKITGTHSSDITYHAFIIGTKCEAVSISFNPGVNYMDDALLTNHSTGSGNTIVNYAQSNYGTVTGSSAEQWTATTWFNQRSLMKFKLWMPSDLNVQEAKLNMTGFAHYPLHRSNISELTRVTANWTETGVSESNKPSQTATGLIDITGTLPLGTTGNQNTTTDIASFFNTWKTNNTQNYGVYFQLKSYLNPVVPGATYTRMKYQSSENTTPPTIDFKVDLYSDAVCTPFAELNYELDGYYYIMKNGYIKFVFNQEYEEANLKFNIYAGKNVLIKTQTDFPAVATTNGDNYISLDVRNTNCLGNGFFYLEVINSKNERTYLRFYNDYNSCTPPIIFDPMGN